MRKQAAAAAVLAILFVGSAALNVLQFKNAKSQASRAAVTPTDSSQSQVLCDVAKEHLKEHWSDQKRNIEKVIQVVNSQGEMEAKLKSTLDEIISALGLTETQASSFRPGYEQLYFEHVGAFRERLNQEPDPDWSGMFLTLKKFYAAEDQLIRATFGEESVTKFRDSQAKKRTPMLALIGQYANVEWDSGIRW